jgi:hypothetical protein
VLGCLSPCYLLILGKPSSCPRIYVGCGTHTARGVVSRLQYYDTKTNIPRYVQQAFDDGYTITHKGLLCWASIPDVTIRFPVRDLFVLLEVIFALVFWAMISQTKDYGMPRLSPWNAKDIAWDGCCSHSALLESITGEDEGLTVEQITAKLVEMDRLRKEKMVLRTAASQPILRANTKASKRYHCDICNKSYESNHALEVHKTSQMHIGNAAGVRKVLSRPEINERPTKTEQRRNITVQSVIWSVLPTQSFNATTRLRGTLRRLLRRSTR